jgi:hypothetical protein
VLLRQVKLKQVPLLLLLLLIAAPWSVRHTHWQLIRQLVGMAVVALLTTGWLCWPHQCTLCVVALTQPPAPIHLLNTIRPPNVG